MKILLISLIIVLSSCASISNNSGAVIPILVAPTEPTLSWINEANGRVSLSREDAISLYHYLVDVEAYINHIERQR